MVDLNDYFNPVSIEGPDFEHLAAQAGFPHNITIHTDNTPVKEIGRFKIALLGVPEGRNSPNSGSLRGPDMIRGQLYKLAKIPGKSKIIDLGNMKQGVTFYGYFIFIDQRKSFPDNYRRQQCSHPGD
jgi:hypothetical protein